MNYNSQMASNNFEFIYYLIPAIIILIVLIFAGDAIFKNVSDYLEDVSESETESDSESEKEEQDFKEEVNKVVKKNLQKKENKIEVQQ